VSVDLPRETADDGLDPDKKSQLAPLGDY